MNKIVLGFLILAAATAKSELPDPVQSFDELLKKATIRTTTSAPIYFNERANQWKKYRFRINDLKMDIRRTDSLIISLYGLVSFTLFTENTYAFATKEQAKGAVDFDPRSQDTNVITLRYGFKDGVWVLLDGTYSESLGVRRDRLLPDRLGKAFGTNVAPLVKSDQLTIYAFNDENLLAEPGVVVPVLYTDVLLNWRQP